MYRNYSLSTHTKSNRFFGKINLWISQKKKKVKLFRHNWRRPLFLNSDFVFRIRPFFCSSILLFVFCEMCSSLGETFRWSSIPYPYPRQAWHGMRDCPYLSTGLPTLQHSHAPTTHSENIFFTFCPWNTFSIFLGNYRNFSIAGNDATRRILTKYQICQDFYSSHQSGFIHFK